MSVVFRDFGDSSVGTTPGAYSAPIDSNQVVISRFSEAEIDFNILWEGQVFTIAFMGRFPVSGVNFTPLTLADLQSTNLGDTSAISQVLISQGGSYLNSRTFSAPLTFNEWDSFDSQTYEGLTRVLAGDDKYYNSADASFDGGSNCYYLFGGNDTVYQAHKLLKYNDVFYGGEGLDTAVMPGTLSSYVLQASETVWNQVAGVANLPGYYLSHKTGLVNTLQLNEVERLQFSDTMLALDTAVNENAGNAYLLYQAAFNRTPDVEGLGYWIGEIDRGANIVTDVAQNLMRDTEFETLYGAYPKTTEFVNLLYRNVHHRLSDAAGLQYWLDEFAAQGDTLVHRAATLNNFAISAENIANVADQIVDGIQYQAYVG